MANDTISYDFIGEDYAFFRSDLNIANILRENGFGGARERISATIDDTDLLPADGVVLKLSIINKQGQTIEEPRMPFKDGQRTLHFDFDDEVDNIIVRIRIGGEGSISRVPVAFCPRHVLEAQAQLTGTVINDGEVERNSSELAQAAILIKNRSFLAAETLLSNCDASRTARRLLLRANLGMRNFGEVIRLYDTGDVKFRNESAIKTMCIEACANNKNLAKIADIVMDSVLSFKSDSKDFLVQAYRYSALLEPQLKVMLRTRAVRETRDPLRHFGRLLKCGHDMLMDGELKQFSEFITSLSSLKVAKSDQIKIRLLQSQAAFQCCNYFKQVEYLNQALSLNGVEGVSRRCDGSAISADNVTCNQVPPSCVDGPLVSILMTTFNSADTVAYAANSVLRQSYGSIELIVCDDCSSDKTWDILSELAQGDPRMTLLRMATNGGTYRAKNQALAAASGEFVTCQDSDDWAHPRKIETLVYTMESAPVAGSLVNHVRLSREKGLQCRSEYSRPDFSSLMYRRAPVLEKLGFYDSVRAGGDSEFQCRLERVFGVDAIVKSAKLLSFVALSESSLSGGGAFAMDEDAGIFSAPRNEYRRKFLAWHETSDDLYLDRNAAERRFAAPDQMIA